MITEYDRKKAREVVVILPYFGQTVLLQLRDIKPTIIYPDHWGFFGGEIESNEQPKQAALRELDEELNFKPKELYPLSVDYLPDLNNILSYSFFCRLDIPAEHLILSEGQDYGLFNLDEINSKNLYSAKLGKYLPVVPTTYLTFCFQKLFKCVQSAGFIDK